jgi:flagellar hook-associated protein FlgK
VAQLTVLQNAYSANARVLQVAKDMYATLFTAISTA